ncbi:hypothetical protein NLG97_g10745 [Lecanicillium saksenae]|uniref:Uncharacterized protein n=1 Tax=Lecanicillium saksenae TaxID=468837 RepID=A0ACC1QE40_9HYPO|nr:hypothetical protein NLG97_g10745 [Lecanicillium saksenae]
MKSNLDLVTETDGFPYDSRDITIEGQGIFTYLWRDADGTYPIGYVLDRVVDVIAELPASLTGNLQLDRSARTISMFTDLATEPERTAAVAAFTQHLREAGTFPLLKGWRGEPWPVHGRKGELLFSMERAAPTSRTPRRRTASRFGSLAAPPTNLPSRACSITPSRAG